MEHELSPAPAPVLAALLGGCIAAVMVWTPSDVAAGATVAARAA